MKTYQYVVSIDHSDEYDRIGADLSMAALMDDVDHEWDRIENVMRPVYELLALWDRTTIGGTEPEKALFRNCVEELRNALEGEQ